MNSNAPVLQKVGFSNLINWSVRYLLDTAFSYKKDYQLVSISNFLIRNRNIINVQDETKYKRITVKLYNKGVGLRDTEFGKNIGTKNQYIVESGYFILSKIDARNGAFGIVPNDLDGAIVTNDFPTFIVDETKINPRFLVLITTTDQFIKFAQSCSSGTTNRQRIDIDLFLDVKIPLPSLDEQNRIVKNYNDKLAKAALQEAKSRLINKEIENYLFNVLGIEKYQIGEQRRGLKTVQYSKLTKWALSSSLKQNTCDIETTKYELQPIKNLIVFLKGGKTPSKNRKDFWDGEINWTSPKDFNGQFIDRAEDKITEIAVKEASMVVFPPGIFLSVFRSGILRHSFPTALTRCETTINQDLKAYKLNNHSINSYYYLYFTQVFKDYILLNASKKSVTVESINTDEFLDLLIPVPPLQTQNEIAQHITTLKLRIIELKNEAEENRLSAIKEFEQEIFK